VLDDVYEVVWVMVVCYVGGLVYVLCVVKEVIDCGMEIDFDIGLEIEWM